MKLSLKLGAVLLLLIFNWSIGFCQPPDSLRLQNRFYGNMSITSNGISVVPTFSLGEPAFNFEPKFARGRFSIEPELRFSLEADPWSFTFWLRYQLKDSGKFRFRTGIHPAYNYKKIEVLTEGVEKEVIQARRFYAGELAPSFIVNQNISVGVYYLYAYGPDIDTENNHFLVTHASFNHIPFIEKLYFNVSPQVYYLRQGREDGYYAVAYLGLARWDFPFSITSTLNKAIKTEILPEQDFVWNISLVYHFN